MTDTDDARLEIYIRMNDDQEKDYCFSVGMNDTFGDLINIFKVLRLSLRPSVFFEQIPQGFEVSIDPGFLTDNGGMLYNNKANQVTKRVKLSDKVSEFAWPGQLIIPVWKFNDWNFYVILLTLLTWLYTDLPDCISPTPGICLSSQISRVLAYILYYFEWRDLADDLMLETVPNRSGLWAQWLFFGFHILKCLFIVLIFWSGILNPLSMNPHTTYKINKSSKLDDVKKQELLSIGWTGSRRATIEEYREFYREAEIKRHGGLVKASKSGLFDKLRNLGVVLGTGEGFQTPLDTQVTLKELELNPSKFYLNYEFFKEIGEFFETHLIQSDNVNQEIKQFRKYGPIVSNERIKSIVEGRKRAFLDEKAEKIVEGTFKQSS